MITKAAKTHLAPLGFRQKGQARELPKGSLVIGIREIADHLKFSKDTVYRQLKYLVSRDTIKMESATEGTVITIINYDEYQDSDESLRHDEGRDSDAPKDMDATRAERSVGHEPTPNREFKKKKNIYIPDFESVLTEYRQLQGVQKGSKAEKRFHDQVKSESDLAKLSTAIRNYRAFLAWPENAWRKPKVTFETFLGSKVSGFFWHDFVELPVRGLNAPSQINTTPISLEDAL